MASKYDETSSSEPTPQVVEDDSPTYEPSAGEGVDAQAEDGATGVGSETQQAKNELGDLDTDNIIDDSPGVSTRGARNDALKQDKEIDSAVDSAEQELES